MLSCNVALGGGAAGDEDVPQAQAGAVGWLEGCIPLCPTPVCTQGERMPCEPEQRARDHSWEESLES